MKHLLLLIFLQLIVNHNYAQSWDGGAGTMNWSDKANWVGDVVPTATSDVIIEDADVNLNVDGFCQSVELKGTATLTIGGIATLKIEELTGIAFHIKVSNKATLTNTGFIDISNQVNTSIINDGQFNNIGLTRIEDGVIALRNDSNGTFINDGDLQILNCAKGIQNDGTFNNEDEILIDTVLVGGFGINNNSTFTNDNSGEIIILRTNSDVPALNIAASGTFTNNGIVAVDQSNQGIVVFGNLINNDSISIKNTEAYPLTNNGGRITNTFSASIAILKNTEANIHGIWNRTNGTINNDGSITVDSITGNGLRNEGICHVGGLLKIQNIGDQGIMNSDTLLNTGIVDINVNSNHDIIDNRNSGFIENDGSIHGIHGDFGISNLGTIINKDYIHIDSIKIEAVANSGDFINETGGTIVCNNSGTGYWQSLDGTTSNYGTIDITDVEDGLEVSGNFNNFNTVKINTFASRAVNFEEIFNNEIDARIIIDGGPKGIIISFNGSLINKGRINIDNITSLGIEVLETATFDQKTTGTLSLRNITGDYLDYYPFAVMSFQGEVTLGN